VLALWAISAEILYNVNTFSLFLGIDVTGSDKRRQMTNGGWHRHEQGNYGKNGSYGCYGIRFSTVRFDCDKMVGS
jgi:hypothetical protein